MSPHVGSPGEKRRQAAQAATQAATQRLRARHLDEYELLIQEERAARGLGPERTELERANARIAQLETELAALSRNGASNQDDAPAKRRDW